MELLPTLMGGELALEMIFSAVPLVLVSFVVAVAVFD
ncbi:unannotated protein [freshwater metagenome]|uniref:Unannotated protein n=1 Tax=freshwater metagenome TaxID=449393 RepID=A0A6J6C167_9ZZZZ